MANNYITTEQVTATAGAYLSQITYVVLSYEEVPFHQLQHSKHLYTCGIPKPHLLLLMHAPFFPTCCDPN